MTIEPFKKFNAFGSACERGWFVGHFNDNPELNTTDLEAQIVKLKKGDKKDGSSYNKQGKTLGMLIYGAFELDFDGEKVRLDKEGDFVIFQPMVNHTWEALEDSMIVSIRWPSLPGDVVKT